MTMPQARLFAIFFVLAASSRPLPQQAPGKAFIQKGIRLRPVSLADVSASSESSHTGSLKIKASHEQQAAAAAKNPLPSGWFGDFSQDESTFTTEGLDASRDDPEYTVKYGRDPSLSPAIATAEVFPSKWFHESLSAGPEAAWQTNDPSISSSVAGNGVAENHWKQTPEGWVDQYRTMLAGGSVGPGSADWFDNSIREVDGFSRKMQPGVGDGSYYVASNGWQEKSVNTTLTCKEVGCTARVSLQLFDATKEEGKLCSLSVDLHPTDYDDDWSREHVEFLKINGFVASRECNPRARGCNATAEKPLYPCLNGFNVDKLVDDKGTLIVEGKNSKMVDECPYKGNLLSGVAMATCMVRPLSARPKAQQPVAAMASTASKNKAQTGQALFSQSDLFGEAPLKCNTPGCTAEATVYITPAIALNGGKCEMNVSVWQTDFDDALGVPEQIDFIQVEGKNVTTAPLQPGKNPCNAKYKGTNTSKADMKFAALTSYDITELIKKSMPLGALKVRGKISDAVDECAYQKNLLSGNVTVRCTPPANLQQSHPPLQRR